MAAKKDPRLTDLLEGHGPGAYLRKARLEAGIGIDKVASALLLNPDRVEALEADAYERLPAPTFVRGYLRGYTRVLGLASGPVLEMYDRQGFEPPPLTTDITKKAQAHTSDTAVRIVTYAVAAVLALLVGLWWHSQEDGGFGIGSDLLSRPPDAGQDSSLLAGEESETTPDGIEPDGVSGPAMPLQSGASSADDDDPAASPAENAVTADITAAETAPDGESGPTAPLQSGASSAEDDVDPAASPAENTATADITAAETAPDGESGPTAPLQSGASSTGDDDDPATSPAENATTADITAAETTPDGESDPTAPLQSGASSADDDAPVTPPAEEATTGTDATAEATTQDTELDGGSVALAPLEPSASSAGDDAPITPPGEAATTGDIAAVAPVSTEVSAPEATVDRDEAPVTQESQPEVVAEAEIGTVRSGLVLEFVHESWVEVYDHERTRLFFDLVQPGRTLDINGTPPFDILLGYGKDVRVAIDGQAFDLTPHLKHGVARFSIGAGPADGDDGTDVAESAGTTAPDATDTQASDPESQIRGR